MQSRCPVCRIHSYLETGIRASEINTFVSTIEPTCTIKTMHLTACWYYYNNSMHKHVDKAIILPDTFLIAVKQRSRGGRIQASAPCPGHSSINTWCLINSARSLVFPYLLTRDRSQKNTAFCEAQQCFSDFCTTTRSCYIQ